MKEKITLLLFCFTTLCQCTSACPDDNSKEALETVEAWAENMVIREDAEQTAMYMHFPFITGDDDDDVFRSINDLQKVFERHAEDFNGWKHPPDYKVQSTQLYKDHTKEELKGDFPKLINENIVLIKLIYSEMRSECTDCTSLFTSFDGWLVFYDSSLGKIVGLTRIDLHE